MQNSFNPGTPAIEQLFKSVEHPDLFRDAWRQASSVVHVQERRLTLPEIKSFIAENGLRFIGFEFPPQVMQHYRNVFGGDRFMRDLDRWHAFETEKPDTFAGMYQFWLQKD